MILSYTLPLAEQLITNGVKIHTMRQDLKERWDVGKLIHHTVNNRSKQQRTFLINSCKGIQKVLLVLEIKQHPSTGIKFETLHVTIDRKTLSKNEIFELALKDGFDKVSDMCNWFFPVIDGERQRTMWTGKLIHWTDKLY